MVVSLKRESSDEALQRLLDEMNSGSGGVSNKNYFSPADTYNLQAQGYYGQGNTALGDAYSTLWKGSNAYSNTANQINNFYDVLANDIANREQGLAGAKYNLARQLNQDLLSQRDYVMNTFGPEGTLTKEINTYYDDLGNYLATDAGRETAKIAAQGIHSGASLGAIRAQQNAAYNESFARYIQAKEQEINAKQTIAANLINYMSTLRQEYGNTTNQYIIQQYQRANDLLNAISQSIANSNIEIASAKLSSATGGKGSSSNGSVIIPQSLRDEYISKLDAEQLKTFNSLPADMQNTIIANYNYNQLSVPKGTSQDSNFSGILGGGQ